MRRLIGIYNNLRISLKLDLVVLCALGALIAAAIVLVRFGVDNLSDRASQRRVEDEVRMVQSRFAEAERGVLADAKVLASTPGLTEAVANRDTDLIRTLSLAALAPLAIDEVDIADAEGVRLVTVARGDVPDSEALFEGEGKQFSFALMGIETTGLVPVEGQESSAHLVWGVPLRDEDGVIVGALVASREVDDSFLKDINFGRSSVHLVFIYRGEAVARHVEEEESLGEGALLSEYALDAGAVEEALGGQVVLGEELIHAHNEVYVQAYAPLGWPDVAIAVLVNMSDIYRFQRQLSQSLSVALAGLGVLVLGLLALVVHRSVSLPLGKLQAVAEKMATGSYWQRAKVTSEDEVGRLADAFNKMAHTVQSRETDLQNLAGSLEQQVEERTTELRAQAESLAQTNRELEVARQQAEEANRLKSEFLSTISHELRTPLNAINGYAQIMLAGMTGEFNEEQQDCLERLWNNGLHLLGLVNDILDLAKIEAGRIEMVKEPLVLRRWLDEVASQVQGLADEKKLRFDVVLDERLPRTIIGDADRLKQIAINLLSNAFKFTDEGSVKLTVRLQGEGTLELTVTDTGVGIPSHAQEYIFDEFRQVDGSSRRRHSGTGLGLAIVRNLCMMMGGNVRVKSQVGQGSTFTVLLPLEAATMTIS